MSIVLAWGYRDRARIYGREVTDGTFSLSGPDTEFVSSVHGAGKYLYLPIPEHLLDERMLGAAQGDVFRPGFKLMGQASPSALAMLLNTLDMIQRIAMNPSAGHDERLRRNLQNALLNALHYVITPELARSEQAPRNFIQRTRLFRRAFDHLRVQPPHAYSVMDLCRELHVPEPAMRAVFLEFTGMGPAEFIQRLRLERMRRAWRASAGTDQDLRDAVLDAGFNEVDKARELLAGTVAAVGAFAPLD